MTNKLTVMPATEADVRAAYGAVPRTVRAWKAVCGDQIIGIGGVMPCPPPQAHTVFLKMLDRDFPKKTIYKAIAEGINLVKNNYPFTLAAIRDCGERGSASLLARAGFVFDGLDAAGKERFVWRKP